ncbi:MAG: hypothetical protein RBT74_06505 [Tenuifilaceae bacterium]|jgi:hypothetical protein|nr:hypothetical protein [Tenuifilaceae bacterium]
MGNKNSFKLVLERLLDAEQLLRVGIEKGTLSSIERDILLEKLRASYEVILFDKQQPELPEPKIVGKSEVNVNVADQISKQPVEEISTPTPQVKKAESSPSVNETVVVSSKLSEKSIPTQVEVDQMKDEDTLSLESENNPNPQPGNKSGEVDVEEIVATNGTAERQSAPTLGEMYQGKRKFRNEVLGAGKKDMSSVIQNKPIADLTKAIGINDKFLFTKELFNGNAELYSKSIKQLNSFDNINDALIYIQENFSWDDHNEAANQLIELVRRKLLHD